MWSLSFLNSFIQFDRFDHGDYVRKSDVKDIISKIETASLDNSYLTSDIYKNKKGELEKKLFVSKQDIADYIKIIKQVSKNPETKYMYWGKIDDLESTPEEDVLALKISRRMIGHRSVAIIRLKEFNETATEKLVNEFQSKAGTSDAVILDLRGNLGGRVTDLVKIADLFMPLGYEVLTKTWWDSVETTLTSDDKAYSGRIYICVSNDSASCSEILALTLKRYSPESVKVIGTQTVGKSVGQSVLEFQGSGLRVGVVAFKWSVGGETVDDLQRYIKTDGYGIKFDGSGDYLKYIEQDLMKHLREKPGGIEF